MNKNQTEKQNGSILIEGVMIIPLLALMLVGSFELYRCFKTYMNFSHSAREVALIGSTVKNLSGSAVNLSVTESDYNSCYQETQTIPGSDCGQKILQWSALKLVKSQTAYYQNQTLEITTSLDSATNVVTVKIGANYKGAFSIFKSINIGTTEQSLKIGK